MTVAETAVSLMSQGGKTAPALPKDEAQMAALYKRWRFYGVALFDQQQFETAAFAFEQARMLARKDSPEEVASSIDLALTYMRMERAGNPQTTIKKASECIFPALEIAPKDGRARFYRALINIKQFKYGEALADFEASTRNVPERSPSVDTTGLGLSTTTPRQ